MERAPRHSAASNGGDRAAEPFAELLGWWAGGEGSRGTKAGLGGRSDKVRLDGPGIERGTSVHGCQGTVLKRLAVTKRMKGGGFHSFLAALVGARRGGRRRCSEQLARWWCWASVQLEGGGAGRGRSRAWSD